MAIRNRSGINFSRYLNYSLEQNPFYRALFDRVDDYLGASVTEQLAQLGSLRDNRHIHRGDYIDVEGERLPVSQVQYTFPDGLEGAINTEVIVDQDSEAKVVDRNALHSRDTLIQNAKLLGFDYYSDTMSDMSYVNVIEAIAQFWPENANPDFINFIGYVKQVRLEMEQLWGNVNDGETHNFLEPYSSGLKPIYNDGAFYPTSHYEVGYDVASNPQISLEDLVNLFYIFAPINYVLERTVGFIRFEDRYSIRMAGAVHLVTSCYENLDEQQYWNGNSPVRIVPSTIPDEVIESETYLSNKQFHTIFGSYLETVESGFIDLDND